MEDLERIHRRYLGKARTMVMIALGDWVVLQRQNRTTSELVFLTSKRSTTKMCHTPKSISAFQIFNNHQKKNFLSLSLSFAFYAASKQVGVGAKNRRTIKINLLSKQFNTSKWICKIAHQSPNNTEK